MVFFKFVENALSLQLTGKEESHGSIASAICLVTMGEVILQKRKKQEKHRKVELYEPGLKPISHMSIYVNQWISLDQIVAGRLI